jgi:hypothetical protein
MNWYRRRVRRKEWLYLLAALNAGSGLAALAGMLWQPTNASSLTNPWRNLVALALVGFILSWPTLPLTIALFLNARREALARSREWCVRCGYALAGLSACCPECGVAVHPSEPDAEHRAATRVPLSVWLIGAWTALSGLAALCVLAFLLIRVFTFF